MTAYYHRIESYARRTHVPADVLLGYVLAHELGHVLLRSDSHTAGGLMRADWRPHELAAMLDRHLGFDPLENGVMRAGFAAPTLARRGADPTGAGEP